MDTDRRSLTMSEVMMPEKANFAGNIHGGYLLQLLDRVAYACAARYSGHYVVTLSVDQVMFKKPIHVGELITCYANINYASGITDVKLTNVQNLAIGAPATTITLTPTAVPAGTGTKLYLLKVEFFQQVNAVQYSLKNGAFNALRVIEIA